jgi:chromosome segregation ATPase
MSPDAQGVVLEMEVQENIDLEDALAEDVMNVSILHDKLRAIQSNSLRKLLAKQNEILERIAGLAELPNMMEAERQRAILEADLKSVRAEYAKRSEQVGVLVNELFAMYDELGMKANVAREDSNDDKAKRKAAKDAVDEAVKLIGTLEARIAQAEKDKEEVENSWWPIGKQAKIEDAKESIENLKQQLSRAKERLEEAKDGIAVVEEQIEVDKADRVRKASVSENITLIREFTQQTTNILSEEVENTGIRIDQTEKALASALTKKRETARDLDELRDEIKSLERDLARERNALDEILDKGSSEFAEQQKIVTDLELQMTEMSGKEVKLNTTHMSMTQAIEANKSSLAGMKVQKDTAEVFLIKLSAAEKTAEVLGRNIEQMQKNAMQETASDTLDRVTDKVILTTVTMGIEAEAASGNIRNEAIERHDELMRQIHAARGAGDEVMAAHAAKYLELDAKIRKGYKDRGIDLDMGNLVAAAASFEQSTAEIDTEVKEAEVTY